MTTSKSSARSTKKPLEKNAKKTPAPTQSQLIQAIVRPYERVRYRIRDLLSRRPHRSFRRTRRRDYVRSLKLPGYWAFTNQVRSLLWRNKKLFLLLSLTYAVLTGVFVGLGSQGAYDQLTDALQSTGNGLFEGNWGKVGEASLLLTTVLSSGLNDNLSDVQRVYSGLVVLMAWLTTVWLLRVIMAGRKPRLRDGIYNAGAPIVPTFLVGMVLILQLLPAALAAIGLRAALSTGILDGGVITMLFWVIVLLLAALSLYWVTSTVVALVVVTLPGMYPLQAIKTAGDLVIGRRVRVVLRLLWLVLGLLLLWAVTMIPIILFDAWIKGVISSIQWLPIVPVSLLVLSSVTIVLSASYVYVLYRKVVDDDAAPA